MSGEQTHLAEALKTSTGAQVRVGGPPETDFGNVARGTNCVVARASTAEQLRAIVQFAAERKRAITLRGARHSCRGQTLADDAILVDYFDPGLVAIERRSEADFEISAAMSWETLERELNAVGRSCPVLTKPFDFAVGGTLSVGGYGNRSVREGAQVDHVRSLALVLPSGERRVVSPASDPELFSYALCGLGQVGAIESVVLRTIPKKESSDLLWFDHEEPAEIEGILDQIEGDPGAPIDEYNSVIFPNQVATWIRLSPSEYRIEDDTCVLPGGTRFAPNEVAETDGNPFDEAKGIHRWAVEGHARHRRLWTDYKLAPAAARELLRFVTGPSMPRRAEATYVMAIRLGLSPVRFPLSTVAHVEGPFAVSVGTFHMVAPGDEQDLERAKEALRQTLARAIELGGRPYLYGWNELDDAAKSKLYGAGYARLVALKRELDPLGRFNATSF
jgi:FAD/FMN-containing dehydrogenase